jgi:TP901 family phage tail tape measure protein
MHEAGSIGFRIQAVGAEVFRRDLDAASKATEDLGKATQETARKTAPLSKEIDKTTKSSKESKAPVESAAQATRRLAAEAAAAEKKIAKAAAEVERLKRESDAAGKTIGTAALGIGTAFAAVALLTVGTYASFDQAASKTTAATQANLEQQEKLKASAIELGASSIYTAKEAAEAQTELAKAGVQVNDILGGGLSGSLALAAAGELGVARAAEIAATTLSVFGLKGDQATHVADLLAAGAGKAQGSVDDLSLGLDYVGVSFARLKIPLEDTVGTLALLAKNGLLGEKAGTGLRSVISSLTAPVAKGAQVMSDYGIKVFDAQGEFIGMAGAAEQLKQGLGTLDEETRSAALGAIFGAEAASAAGILYKSGAEGVEEWTEKVDDQGFAAKQAADKTNNLMGDIELLGGSFDSILIKTGGQANGVLRDMVQILIGLTDWYGSLDEGAQGAALGLGVTTAAVLILGGTFMLAVPKIVEFRTALSSLNSTMKGTALVGGIVGVALVAAVAIIGAFGAAQADSAAKVQAFSSTLDEQTGKITKNTREMVKANLAAKDSFLWLEGDSGYDAAKKLGLGLDLVTDAASGNVTSLKELEKALVIGEAGSALLKKQMKESGLSASDYGIAVSAVEKAVSGNSGSIAEAIRVQRQKKEVDDQTAKSASGVAAATGQATAATEEATAANEEYLATLAKPDAAFISLGGAYDAIIEKNKAVAESTAAATEDSGDSWETYYDGFTVGLDNYLAELQAQVDAQTNWESNMILLAGRVSKGVLDELAEMGPEGAPLVADLVNASGEQLGLAEELFAEKGAAATGAFASTLSQSRLVISAAAAQLGQEAADEIAAKLASGTATVAQIMSEYQLKIDGITPQINLSTSEAQANLDAFIASNNGRTLYMGSHVATGPGGSGGMTFADGAVVSYHANGSVSENHVAQHARAGSMRVWAEQETGGETYVPHAMAKRGRSEQIMQETAAIFGGQYIPAGSRAFAGGAVVGSSSPAASTGGGITWTGNIVIDGHSGDDKHLAVTIRRELQDLLRGGTV